MQQSAGQLSGSDRSARENGNETGRVKRAPRTRPGRPSKQESARIDARILDAAWHLFVNQGYSDTSMEAIAERAGVTRMTLYQRHPDKISLFRTTITSRGEGWSKVADQMDWLAGDTLEERLRNYARQMLTWSQTSEINANRRLSEGMSGEAAPVARELERGFLRRITRLLADDIADYAGREGLSIKAPREIAMMVIGLLEMITAESRREGHDLAWMLVSGERALDIMVRGRQAW